MHNIIRFVGPIGIMTLTLAGCNITGDIGLRVNPTLPPTPTQTGTPTPSLTLSPSETPIFTPGHTATPTSSPTETPKPTITDSPTVAATPSTTLTPTISPTPTIDFPDVLVNVGSAHCRYGPGKAYLHAADLYEGDYGLVWNRNYGSTWLWVRFDKLHYACWVAVSVTEIDGDISSISTYSPPLPKSTLYGPPQKVVVTRRGAQVLVTWEEVWMTKDDGRGYLIEAKVCQNGYMIDLAVHTNGNSYTFTDENGCDGQSKGKLYAVEKHGYTDSVPIHWP